MKSLKPDTGRSVVLWPHGVLFRDAESDIRKRMIEEDYVDAVIGLGRSLFYNSGMESCLLVCRMNKPKNRKGKTIFINAINEIKTERSITYLLPEHIKRISKSYHNFKDDDGFCKVISKEEILSNDGNLSVQLYAKPKTSETATEVHELLSEIKDISKELNKSVETLLTQFNRLGIK